MPESMQAPGSLPWRRIFKGLAWAGFACWLVFAALILTLRYGVLPNIDHYQQDIEQAASNATGLQVKIGKIASGWDSLNPHLTLSEVTLADGQGRQAFSFQRVDAVLSWESLWRTTLVLDLFSIDGPVLHVRRDPDGKISVAGIDTEGETDPRILDWLLLQKHIRIHNARVIWDDGLRHAPALVLDKLDFGLDSRFGKHSFALSTTPPAALASLIEVKGEFTGRPRLDAAPDQQLAELGAQLYLNLDHTDLAAWRTWLDFPVPVSTGHGGLRLWADWRGKGQSGSGQFTADVALEKLHLQLSPSVPELQLAQLNGRLKGLLQPDGWQVQAKQLALILEDGLSFPPTDVALSIQNDARSGLESGKASLSTLDLENTRRLAAYFPLPESIQAQLNRHHPRGKLSQVTASWSRQPDGTHQAGQAAGLPSQYQLNGQFSDLALNAAGPLPGFAGLSGHVEASERGGTLQLDSRQSHLDLPSIFPEPRLRLEHLNSRISWKLEGGQVAVQLERMDFANADAVGQAQGHYRYTGNGPGEIDLTASLREADGRAVWRYMPHVVNLETRQWLMRGITAGRASDTRLVLKGDLRDFPYRDKKKGQFSVTTRVRGGRVDYAAGWPAIEDIEAELSFGVGMRIQASKGKILGTDIGPVTVDIPDFEMPEEMLLIRGQVRGPTAEFLRFIDHSPVSDKIDNFTEGMQAGGSGQLGLEIDMPLRHVRDAHVRGEYQFINNQVVAIPGLPAANQVNGRLKFTESSVSAQEINGQLLGGPVRLSIKNEADKVNVLLGGSANVAELRKLFALPMLEQVSGRSNWRGEIKVRKKNADFLIESNLVGVSSSLPEPFNKTASTPMPLRIEKGVPPDNGKSAVVRDQWRVTLGKTVEAVLLRRRDGEDMILERGAVGIGEAAPRLPERNINLNISLARFDLDTWKRLLPETPATPTVTASKHAGLGVISLRTGNLRLQGRDFSQVELSARQRDGGWQLGLSMREANGDLFWRGTGDGWIQAHLKRLQIPDNFSEGDGEKLINSLPGMDIRVDDLSLGDKRLGKLEVRARNERGIWQLETLDISNPDGNLKGRGQWANQGSNRTRLSFELQAIDAGKLLDRLGYPGALKAGNASLKGDLSWDGPLSNLHYPSLSGELSVKTGKGQFAKLEPGVGKLLGLLSLQSLPRRLTLDFRDIFSDGFAFDSIDGQMNIKSGIMRTSRDLKIDGPAARILMRGEADLKLETQNLVVVVQPEVGSVVSASALLLAHPAIAAATIVANKVLQNPLDKAFAFQYRVTGSWDDPKVEKIGQSARDVGSEPAPTKEDKP